MSRLNSVLQTIFNETLSPVQYIYDWQQRHSFWLPLFIDACFGYLINYQLDSWWILRIVSLPNTRCDGVYRVVVCNIDHMENAVDERIPSQGVSLSKCICWILKECIILPIVWCTISIIVFLMGLHGIP